MRWAWSAWRCRPRRFLFALTAGVLIGAAQAGTTYAVIYGVIGRQIRAERRSWAMGVAAAAGSFGQFLMVPVEGQLIARLGWQTALLVLGGAVLLIVPLAFGLREPRRAGDRPRQPRADHRPGAARSLQATRSFLLLTAGYFVCGFQVVFIGVHMPSYLQGQGPVARGGQLCAGADRPVQRLRHLHRRLAGPADRQAQDPGDDLPVGRAVAIAVFLVVPI